MNTDDVVEIAGPEMLLEHGQVPMSPRVSSRLRLEQINGGLTGVRLVEEPIVPPHVKSYEDLNDAPMGWISKWDTSAWGFVAAKRNGRVVGGAVVAHRTNGMNILEGRDDVAVLGDIRVHPGLQRSGVGSRLFGKARAFAKDGGCRFLKIETQNVACQVSMPNSARFACALFAG